MAFNFSNLAKSAASKVQSAAKPQPTTYKPGGLLSSLVGKISNTGSNVIKNYQAPLQQIQKSYQTPAPAPAPTYQTPAPAYKAPTPAPVSGVNLADKYAQAVLPQNLQKAPITPFSQVLNIDTLLNQKAIEDFAMGRVRPEYERQENIAFGDLMKGMASQGANRFGTADVYKQRLADSYARRTKEAAQPFQQSASNLLQDYYNNLETEYYKDPQAFEYQPLNLADFLTKRLPGVGQTERSADGTGFSTQPVLSTLQSQI